MASALINILSSYSLHKENLADGMNITQDGVI